MTKSNERRRDRSEDAVEAMASLFAAQRARSGSECIVLATDDGVSVAHDGDSEMCAELAACAPLFLGDDEMPVDTHANHGADVHVRSFRAAGSRLLLVVRGGVGWSAQEAARESAKGVVRILGA